MTIEERRAYYRNWYKLNRERRRRTKSCIYCGKSDNRTKRGMTACMECAVKHAEYSHKSYMKRKKGEKEGKKQQ